MKAILMNGNSCRILEKIESETDFFKCNYKSYGDSENIDTQITITFEDAINSLIKSGYKLITIE